MKEEDKVRWEISGHQERKVNAANPVILWITLWENLASREKMDLQENQAQRALMEAWAPAFQRWTVSLLKILSVRNVCYFNVKMFLELFEIFSI